MSRRCHHGSPRHARTAPAPARERARPSTPAERRPASETARVRPAREAVEAPATTEPLEAIEQPGATEQRDATEQREATEQPEAALARDASPVPDASPEPDASPAPELDGELALPIAAAATPRPAEHDGRNGAGAETGADDGALERGATGPQLRRFIKSRAYVPMHELRRRFGINGQDDDVTPVEIDRRRVFVGLPEREGRLLGELLRGGDIGYELSFDPISPIVVGVYPMRLVTRP